MNETPETLEKKSTAIKMRLTYPDGSYELFDSKNECAKCTALVMLKLCHDKGLTQDMANEELFYTALQVYNRVRKWLAPCCNSKSLGSSRKFAGCLIEIV